MSETLPVVNSQDLDVPLSVIEQIAPIDPRDLYDAFPGVVVKIDLLVDSEGAVHFLRLSGTTNSALMTAALAGVAQWKFAPPRRGGRPVAAKARIPVIFPSASELVYDFSRLDVLPVVVKRAPVDFPPALIKAGYSGEVRLRFVVNKEGRTEHIRVIKSAHPDFDVEATKSLAKWIFKPGQSEGKPINTWMEVPIDFSFGP